MEQFRKDFVTILKALESHWGALGPYLVSLGALLAFGLLKLLVLSPLSLSMPVPTGVFLPTFVSGAAFGSLYGSLLRRMLPSLFATTMPAYFAVTGAAALACGASWWSLLPRRRTRSERCVLHQKELNCGATPPPSASTASTAPR